MKKKQYGMKQINKFMFFLWILLIIMLLIGCHRKKNSDSFQIDGSSQTFQIAVGKIKSIHAFYQIRHEYYKSPPINAIEFQEMSIRLNQAWDSIMIHKSELIPLLLKYHGKKGNNSFQLYGDYPIDSCKWWRFLPDNIHALYLVEAIVRNDYLFNKRYNTNKDYLPNMKSNKLQRVQSYFMHDALCYIIDTLKNNKKPKDGFIDTFDNGNNNQYLEKAWNLYIKWYNESYTKDNQNCITALDSTSLRWNLFAYYGGANLSSIGKTFYLHPQAITGKDSNIINTYPLLKLKIGKGNPNCPLNRNF